MNRIELLKIAKPILFNTDMVRAIQDGRKTVTRINPFNFEMKEGYNPDWSGYSLGEYYTGCIETGVCLYSRGSHDVWGVRSNVVKPKYNKGDILYVRETWCEVPYEYEHILIIDGYITIPKIAYRADSLTDYTGTWKPSIHMPKSAARIFLKVSDVRVERLQDITEEQAMREGVQQEGIGWKSYNIIKQGKHKGEAHPFNVVSYRTAKFSFQSLWCSLTPFKDEEEYGWNANPWVWVYEFERIENYENNNN